MDDKDKLDQIGRAMQAAWSRVKKAQSRLWGEWMVIGEGLLEGRRWAMHMADTNRPEGKGFVMAYSEWLHRYKVDDMHKSDRAKLLQLMEERPAVEEWRMSLPDYDRRSLNHPTVVWRKWTAATRVKKPKARTGNVSATEHGRAQRTVEELQARVNELEEENAQLQREHRTKKRALRNAQKPRELALEPVDLPGDTPEEQWQRSAANMAGEAISLEAFWSKIFGNEWKSFEVSSDMVTLAQQAVDAWGEIATKLATRAPSQNNYEGERR